jgi:CheY-like chemotaxis protein
MIHNQIPLMDIDIDPQPKPPMDISATLEVLGGAPKNHATSEPAQVESLSAGLQPGGTPPWPVSGRIDAPGGLGADSSLSATLPGNALVEPNSEFLGESDPPPPPLRGVVLVVDDDWISAEVARLMLVAMGFHVDFAVDGRQAFVMASATCYDLILMDCSMPVMTGSEATRALRASSTGLSRASPVIAVTANGRKSDLDECREAGMDDVIVKPLLVENLLQKLALHLPLGKSP